MNRHNTKHRKLQGKMCKGCKSFHHLMKPLQWKSVIKSQNDPCNLLRSHLSIHPLPGDAGTAAVLSCSNVNTLQFQLLMYMFVSKCLEHNSRQRRAKFSVLFKVHFFQTCRGQFTSYKRLHFLILFFLAISP